MIRRLFGLELLLTLVLVACPVTTPDYHLTSVLPSPATPGDVVTVFGVLPATSSLSLSGRVVPAVSVPNGLSFTVPSDLTAGEFEVKVNGEGASLRGALTVNPRLDAVVLEPGGLRVSGLGWALEPAALANTKLNINGFDWDVTLEGHDLRTVLPTSSAYGGFVVTVKVGDRSSQPRTVQYEAGAVSGMVEFPVSASTAISNSTRAARAVVPTRGLIVFHKPGTLETLERSAHLTGILERDALPGLGATRLLFADVQSASVAFKSLTTLASSNLLNLEFDAAVQPSDAFQSVPAVAPRSTRAIVGQAGDGQWHLALEGIPQAWNRSKGEGVTVALIDTGVDLEHPDLKANLLPGYDFIDDDAIPQDLVGHGSHVAGLMAANGLALGVAPKAKILPIRVLRDLSESSSFPVAQGILWSVDRLEGHPNPNPAQVINLSLGSSNYSDLIAQAVNKALEAGAVVVAAAGNSGGSLAYPAALDGVIAVTALAGPSIAYQPWYANRGSGLWLTAYGGDTSQDQDKNGKPDGILSTDLNGGYTYRMGTSMASPQVAGLAALALSSGTPAKFVRQTLAGTATDLGVKGYDLQFGHGLISGRVATPSNPRAYVLAIDNAGKLLSWTLVQTDGSYLLGNLPPNKSLEFLVVTDADNDGLLGESSEMISNSSQLSINATETQALPKFLLNPSNGSRVLALNAR
jgi:serine protease